MHPDIGQRFRRRVSKWITSISANVLITRQVSEKVSAMALVHLCFAVSFSAKRNGTLKRGDVEVITLTYVICHVRY